MKRLLKPVAILVLVLVAVLSLNSCEEDVVTPKNDEGSKTTTVDYADADEEIPIPK